MKPDAARFRSLRRNEAAASLAIRKGVAFIVAPPDVDRVAPHEWAATSGAGLLLHIPQSPPLQSPPVRPVVDDAAAIAGEERAPVPGAHLRAALDGLEAGVVTFNRSLDILFVNTRLRCMLEIDPAVAGGIGSLVMLMEASVLLSTMLVQQVHEACQGAVDRLTPQELTLAAPGARFFSLHVGQLADRHWMASFTEVTAQRNAEAQAIERAKCDPLTGLLSRTLFHDQISALLGAGPDHEPPGQPAAELATDRSDPVRHAVMAVDLDRFKGVNDTLGHSVGDGLLCLVAKRLRSVLRQHDALARLGGDEFALLVSPAPDRAVLDQLARRVTDVIGRPYLVDGHLVNIGASIGIAVFPEDGGTEAELLRNADLALYDAKNMGRSTHSFFRPEMDARAVARRLIEIDLRKALALRQFELHYQPQVDLERHAIVGFEALLRWNHPERGMVSPADFIPLAEEIGLIVPLGEWVLNHACLEATHWSDPVTIAVNVSPYQFEDTGRLVEAVSRALNLSGLPGHRLEIEITESVLLRNAEPVLAALHRLRGMGVRVAMDDFGTGYSSLSQLHSFPFDKIKIDRSFVKDRDDDVGQNAIIRAITALGNSLGMTTIAEGVETAGQLELIRDGGCTSVQGYLFSRPVPVAQVAALIAGYNRSEPPSVS